MALKGWGLPEEGQELVRKLYPNDEAKQKSWIKIHQKRLLDKGKIERSKSW
jgi:hypothetical protein